MNSITLNAPAKINLYLDIISKRGDGYHNIETLFQKIGLCDKVTVSIIEKGIRLDCNYPGLSCGRANIAYKAASLMRKRFGIDAGIGIRIVKNIPVAAGLGGGSSDAAAVITAIDKLFKLALSKKRLIAIAKEIGADVPFFVSGYSSAIGKGIGDRLKELRHNRTFYLLLVVPDVKIYTKTIYSKVTLPLTKKSLGVNMLARALIHNRKEKAIATLLFNGLEEIVFPIYPIVRKAKETLSLSDTEGVLLSGSGPSVFALFNSRKEARRARDRMQGEGKWQIFLTKTI